MVMSMFVSMQSLHSDIVFIQTGAFFNKNVVNSVNIEAIVRMSVACGVAENFHSAPIVSARMPA
jgi:hypothetical protein